MGTSLEYPFSKEQENLVQCSELREWRDKNEDIVRDKHVSLISLSKELVFHIRSNGINIG